MTPRYLFWPPQSPLISPIHHDICMTLCSLLPPFLKCAPFLLFQSPLVLTSDSLMGPL